MTLKLEGRAGRPTPRGAEAAGGERVGRMGSQPSLRGKPRLCSAIQGGTRAPGQGVDRADDHSRGMGYCHPPHCWAWLHTSACCISPCDCWGSCFQALLAPLLFPTLPLPNTPGPLLVSLPLGLALCAPTTLYPGPSPRLSLCPPIGQGSLPRAGGDVFSLVRHPCQKHLVYKLASASRLPLHSSGRWTDKAEAPGPLPPAPGLGRQAHVHPWPPTHNPEGGWPPAARASLKDPT